MAPIARFTLVALDCPDPDSLAAFYAAITGWEIDQEEDDPDQSDWVELRSDGGATIAFQRVSDHRPPDWPGSEHPQQAHLDFDVPDLDAGEAALLAIGATKAATQPHSSWRVFLDPAGHPFCLVHRPGLEI